MQRNTPSTFAGDGSSSTKSLFASLSVRHWLCHMKWSATLCSWWTLLSKGGVRKWLTASFTVHVYLLSRAALLGKYHNLKCPRSISCSFDDARHDDDERGFLYHITGVTVELVNLLLVACMHRAHWINIYPAFLGLCCIHDDTPLVHLSPTSKSLAQWPRSREKILSLYLIIAGWVYTRSHRQGITNEQQRGNKCRQVVVNE